MNGLMTRDYLNSNTVAEFIHHENYLPRKGTKVNKFFLFAIVSSFFFVSQLSSCNKIGAEIEDLNPIRFSCSFGRGPMERVGGNGKYNNRYYTFYEEDGSSHPPIRPSKADELCTPLPVTLTPNQEALLKILMGESNSNGWKAFLTFLAISALLWLGLSKLHLDAEVREKRRKVRADEKAKWEYAFKKKLKETEMAKKQAERERSWKAREDWFRRKEERRKAYYAAIEAKKEKARQPGRLREERKKRRREELEGKKQN